MTAPDPPSFEPRRAGDFARELIERAQAWVAGWAADDDPGDFGSALLKVAAQFSGEVAERLDKVGEKMSLGFLDWLAVRGGAAQPARMAVSFKLADTTHDPVLAAVRTQLQATPSGSAASVVFETEDDILLVPGLLQEVVGADPAGDAYYLPPPGLSSLDPVDPLPTQWQVKTLAAAQSTTLQLDPALGLDSPMVVEILSSQYCVTPQSGALVSLEPAVPAGGFAAGTLVSKVSAFHPFDPGVYNWQMHALYIGDDALLDIDAAASIKILGAQNLPGTLSWEYRGKGSNQGVAWQPLTPAVATDGVVLTKPAGSIESTPVGPKKISSRWLRGSSKQSTSAANLQSLSLAINADVKLACSMSAGTSATPGAPAQGFYNSTALDFNNVFYPLGLQPRLYDTFYLACAEAFSKPNAQVSVCFQLGDATVPALSAVRGGQFASRVLAGVGADGALHLFAIDGVTGAVTKFRDRDPLQPPSPADAGQTPSGSPGPLDASPPWRVPVWTNNNDFYVAASSGTTIWIWHENAADAAQSGWIVLPTIPVDSASASKSATGVACVTPAGTGTATLYVLWPTTPAATVYSFDVTPPVSGTWNPSGSWKVVDFPGLPAQGLSSLVAVVDDIANPLGGTNFPKGLVGVGGDLKVYALHNTPNWKPLSAAIASIKVRPAALVSATQLYVFAVSATQQLLAMKTGGGVVVTPASSPLTLSGGGDTVTGPVLDVVLDTARVSMLASVKSGGSSYLLTWSPFEALAAAGPFVSQVPPNSGVLAGAPTALDVFVVAPGDQGQVLAAGWNLALRKTITPVVSGGQNIFAGIAVPAALPALAPGDYAALFATGAAPSFARINDYGTLLSPEVFYPLDPNTPFFGTASGGASVVAFQCVSGTAQGGTLAMVAGVWNLTLSDPGVGPGSELLISTTAGLTICVVGPFAPPAAAAWPVPLTAQTPINLVAGNASFWPALPTGGRIAPWFTLGPGSPNNWDASILKQATLYFDPSQFQPNQIGKAFKTDGAGHPLLVALDAPWTNSGGPPPPPYAFVLDAAVGSWSQQQTNGVSNPRLAWEYWNGTSWWKLLLTQDATQNFKNSGAVSFQVPTDLGQTQVSGRPDYWIRAVLVSGNYGQDQVSVITKDLGNGQTQQTVVHSPDAIRPPAVLTLTVRYKCAAASPQYVLTQDSGSYSDQSDANRAGAVITAFVPLATLIARLTSGPLAGAASASTACPPDCQCDGTACASTNTPSAAAQPCACGAAPAPSPTPVEPCCSCPEAPATGSSTAASTSAPASTGDPSTDRAIFLGLSATLGDDGPINLLFVVDQERSLDDFAPLAVDALIGGRFAPLVLNDTTRALGETGLLSLTFSVLPQPAELFGATLTWLRLRPSRLSAGSQWAPDLAGVYLNAVWATAAETMTLERVGSSDGRPSLAVQLARPPVLDHTLELRVNEPIGDEERTVLLDADSQSVLYEVPNLPGNWVKWKQVIDTADSGPQDRDYALDESSGQITFGDGLHGKIPPIGTDAIVAFTYRRTEPPAPGSTDVPANGVTARSQLGLVSPVQGVESAYAATDAAGGAPAETGDRVFRFGTARLRHRNRALTAQDFEDLALASSVDIAQARCFVVSGSVRLVVVMRGADPAPSAAARRELAQTLLSAGPVSLAKPGALSIAAPGVRNLRIDLTLQVPTLEDAGQVGEGAKSKLEAWFDPETGGGDGSGWPLGASPVEDDVGLALAGVPKLDSIQKITLLEIAADGTESPWPASIRSTDLAMLADDPVRIVFAPLEVSV